MAVKGQPRARFGRHADGGGRHRRAAKTAPGHKLFTVAVGIAKLEFYNSLREGAGGGRGWGRFVIHRLPPSAQDRRRVPVATVRRAVDHSRDRNGYPGASGGEDARCNEAPTATCMPVRRECCHLDRSGERHWRELERSPTFPRRPRSENRVSPLKPLQMRWPRCFWNPENGPA